MPRILSAAPSGGCPHQSRFVEERDFVAFDGTHFQGREEIARFELEKRRWLRSRIRGPHAADPPDEYASPSASRCVLSQVTPPSGGAHWVKPKLVGEIGFREWTREGNLRNPRYLGPWFNKRPLQVVREQ